MTLYREATRDEIMIDDLGVASAVDVYTMDVVEIKGPVYRTNFGPTDDGSTDTREAHDAWMEVQDLARDGWLMGLELDYEAAAKCLWYQERYTDFREATTEEQSEYRRRARFVVNAALGIGGDDE